MAKPESTPSKDCSTEENQQDLAESLIFLNTSESVLLNVLQERQGRGYVARLEPWEAKAAVVANGSQEVRSRVHHWRGEGYAYRGNPEACARLEPLQGRS